MSSTINRCCMIDSISGRMLKFTAASIAAPVTDQSGSDVETVEYSTYSKNMVTKQVQQTTDQSLCFQY